jgi:hypothetical protein
VHPTPEERLAAITARQLGLITSTQARAAGLTSVQLRYRVRRGDLVDLGGAVLAVAGHEPTWEQTVLAALLAAGSRAVVSHRAAARLLGFDGFADSRPEVTVPRGRRPRLPAGATVHTTLRHERIDTIALAPFRMTSGARTVIDLAVTATDRELEAAIGSAVRDGWTSVPFLRRRFAALRGPGRHGAALLASVLEAPPGHSDLERRFLRLVARAGLPLPVTQRSFPGRSHDPGRRHLGGAAARRRADGASVPLHRPRSAA